MKWVKFGAAVLLVLGLGFTVYTAVRGDPTAEVGKLIDRADRLVILLGDETAKKAQVYASTSRADLDALKASLVVTNGDGICKCGGLPTILLYSGETEIGLISNQHRKAIRFSGWMGNDPRLVGPKPFLQWFADRGFPEVLHEDEGELHRAADAKRAEIDWLAAMPPATKSLREQVAATKGGKENVPELLAAHARAVPDGDERIRQLFHWYGSGAGPWSGFPSYESVAAEMLLTYPTADLIRVAERPTLSPQETEGAARLFAGRDFHSRRPNDLQLLPADLKAKLLRHCATTADQDKLDRARAAFRD